MVRKFFVFIMATLLFLSLSSTVHCQYNITIKSKFFSFNLNYPYDWHCESEYGLPKNIQAVLSPQNFLIDSSPATIFVRVIPRTTQNFSLKEFINNDFLNVKKRRPKIQYGTDFILSTKDHKNAQVKTYFEEPQGLYDAIAYIPEKKAFVIIILQTTSQKAYLRALPTFRNIVMSYQFALPQDKSAPLPPKMNLKKPKKKKAKRKTRHQKQSTSFTC